MFIVKVEDLYCSQHRYKSKNNKKIKTKNKSFLKIRRVHKSILINCVQGQFIAVTRFIRIEKKLSSPKTMYLLLYNLCAYQEPLLSRVHYAIRLVGRARSVIYYTIVFHHNIIMSSSTMLSDIY